MILYYAPMACSLASRIAGLERGLAMTFHRVDLRSRDRGGLAAKNPMNKVPTLILDDDQVLTENVAVLSYLDGDATAARYELLRWLGFVATELHKGVAAPLFALDAPPEPVKHHARRAAAPPLACAEAHLRERQTLVGDDFTVADAYLLWALTVLPAGGVSLADYPALQRYHAGHLQRPAVAEALRLEAAEYRRHEPSPAPADTVGA